MIVIIDCGMGNLASIANMIKRTGSTVQISSDHSIIGKADKLVLPGVGSFDYGISCLEKPTSYHITF